MIQKLRQWWRKRRARNVFDVIQQNEAGQLVFKQWDGTTLTLQPCEVLHVIDSIKPRHVVLETVDGAAYALDETWWSSLFEEAIP